MFGLDCFITERESPKHVAKSIHIGCSLSKVDRGPTTSWVFLFNLQRSGVDKSFSAFWLETNNHDRNFPDYPETFQIIRKLLRLSGNFPGYPETFRTIQKISRLSRYFPETFRIIGNFPDNLESSQCNFKGYTQKLSRRAKTFRMAMPPCHQGFWASEQILVDPCCRA